LIAQSSIGPIGDSRKDGRSKGKEKIVVFELPKPINILSITHPIGIQMAIQCTGHGPK